MYKGREMIGKSIVSYDTGEKFNKIRDLIFDQNSNQLLGFVVNDAGWFSGIQVLELKDVQAIGPDIVITSSQNVILKGSEIPVINRILEKDNILKDTMIMTTDGRSLGNIIDLYFDEITGVVEGYEVSGGIFADAFSGRSFVPAVETLKIGKNVAFVTTQTAQMMEEQVGGIKGAFQATSDKVQEKAQANRVILDDARRNATAFITNAIIKPEEQKAFVIGKTVEQDVDSPNGEVLILQGQVVTPSIAAQAESESILDKLYQASGGSLSNKLSEQVGNRVASLTLEQAEGKRVQQFVISREGSIIAAPGQIVTQQVITRTKANHQEQALLSAVGLSTGDAAHNQTSDVMTVTGEKIKSTTQRTGKKLQEGTKGLWVQVKDTATDLQERSTQAIETQKIKGALGRPVSRVILDQSDVVLLNVGELITHQAVEQSRLAGVLDILLSSVYNEKPELSLKDLQAPTPGIASL